MKGQKTGGRAKGTPNRATAAAREIINHLVADYYADGRLSDDADDSPTLMSDFLCLEPRERIAVAVKLIGLITPKKLEVDNTADSKTIDERLRLLSQGIDPAASTSDD